MVNARGNGRAARPAIVPTEAPTVPENSVLPSQDDAGTSRRASTKAQIIPIDDATKSFSLFISEQKLAEHKPDATAAAVEPTPAGSIPAESDSRTEHTPNAARGTLVSIRGAAIALLVLAVVSQAGFIAYEKFWVTPVAVAPVTGTLRVTSEPDGAAVIIDGATQGKTPLEVSLSAGAHTV